MWSLDSQLPFQNAQSKVSDIFSQLIAELNAELDGSFLVYNGEDDLEEDRDDLPYDYDDSRSSAATIGYSSLS